MTKRTSLTVLAAGLALLATHASPNHAPLKRWVYLPTNFLVDEQVTARIADLERWAGEGYNGVVVTDFKFMAWDTVPDRYVRNVRRFRDATRRLTLEVIAGVMPLGHSGSLLYRDPNLAEGLPVVDAPFVVSGGRLEPWDDGPSLRNGGFEQFKEDRADDWSFIDKPGEMTFIDTTVIHDGRASLRVQDVLANEPDHRHARACQTLRVKPFRYYHVSVWIRTQDWNGGDVRIAAIGGDGASLNFHMPPLAASQDWTRADITFNTLDNTRVNLYLGTWDGRQGTLWWDDVRFEPAGFVNVLRRPGTPLTVRSEDGATLYEEGRDFAPVRDPKLGNDPWAGDYSAWHESPTVAIPIGSRLRDGQHVLASYYHTAVIYDGQVPCCLSEPKVYEILGWQVNRVREALAPDAYLMNVDEIRIQGWDKACADRALTCGEILADSVQRCVAIIRKADPGRPIWVWSDMFDPNHGAGKSGRSYLVKGDGPWYGSWKGLPADVGIVNWNMGPRTRRATLEHFAKRGHRQVLAGFYDGDPTAIAAWLKDADASAGVDGVMYTTWRSDYHATKAFLDSAGSH